MGPMLSHVWLCNPIACSPPGSSVHGVSQSRILDWAVISYFKVLIYKYAQIRKKVFQHNRFSAFIFKLNSFFAISKWLSKVQGSHPSEFLPPVCILVRKKYGHWNRSDLFFEVPLFSALLNFFNNSHSARFYYLFTCCEQFLSTGCDWNLLFNNHSMLQLFSVLEW